MTIGSLDELVSGLLGPRHVYKSPSTAEAAGTPHSLFYVSGNPGAATAPTGLNGSSPSRTTAGALPFPAAVTGESIYLAGLSVAGDSVGALVIADRLWHNGTIAATTTTAQAITHPGLPSRDLSGAALGEGVLLGIEVSTATGNGSAITNMTASYTDQDGNAGNTATVASFPATAAAGSFIPFDLASGDSGVRSVQSLTLGTSLVSGTVHLVQYRPIAVVGLATNNRGERLSAIDLGMPLVHDNSCLFAFVVPTATSVGYVSMLLNYAQG